MSVSSKSLNKYIYPVNVALHCAEKCIDINDSDVFEIMEVLDNQSMSKITFDDMVEDLREIVDNELATNQKLVGYQKYFDMRFRRKMTFETMSEKIGISTERIRQILYKGIRILNGATSIAFILVSKTHPNPFKRAEFFTFVQYGQLPYFYELAVAAGYKPNHKIYSSDQFVQWIKRDPRLLKIGKMGIMSYIKDIEDELDKSHQDVIRLRGRMGTIDPEKEIPCVRIDEMNLSVRAYGSLARGGIRNLEELLDRTQRELLKLNGIGKGTLEEIVNKVKEYGFELK